MSLSQQPSLYEGFDTYECSDCTSAENQTDLYGGKGSFEGSLDTSATSPTLAIFTEIISHLSSTSSPEDNNNGLFGDPDLELGSGSQVEGGEEESLATVSTFVIVTVLSLLVIVTIVGNLLVCISVILVRKLRKPQNYLLVSLAISDVCVGMLIMPFAILFEVHGGHWPLNNGLCDLWVSADVLCCTASILNLCGISCDRYRAITTPLEYSAKTTPRRMLGIIFIVWLLSACVSLPPVLLLGNVHTDIHGGSFCSVSQNFWYQIYATMASFYVPLCVMVVVYVKILRVVADKKKQMSWKHQSIHRTSSSTTANSNSTTHSTQPLLANGKKGSVASSIVNQHVLQNGRNSVPGGVSTSLLTATNNAVNNNTTASTIVALNNSNNVITSLTTTNTNINKGSGTYFFPSSTLHRLKKEKLFGGLKEHKASTVLGIIMSAFVICWLPFFILAIMRPFLTINNVEIPGWVSSLFNWLGYANSALNPLIYATLNRDFRRPFKEILCFRCATLDSLMRREFYHAQYGDDKENIARRASKAHIHIHAPSDTMEDPDQLHYQPINV